MEGTGKRNLFLAVVVLLLAALAVLSVMILLEGPRDSVVQLVDSGDTEFVVNDLYEGDMTIPRFNVPTNSYEPDSFSERNGVVSYRGGVSLTGVNVNLKMGDIDWQQVADSGVDYAMIRVGYRKKKTGQIVLDSNFETNMRGAADAGIPVGVYFYSKAISDAEADEEAAFVLDRLHEGAYEVTYPVAFYWEYDLADDGSRDLESRTVRCNGDQVTGFIDAFCGKIKASGFKTSYYCDKTMGYNSLNLEKLSGYDMWYSELRSVPSFYYDFAMWQYTKEGNVPGISEKVPFNLCLKKYE